MILAIVIAAIMMMNSNDGTVSQPTVRPATQAGRFYEGNAQLLSQEVDSFLALHANRGSNGRVAALIVPHAGYYFSGNVAASAYMSLPADSHYKRIFLLGPSHHVWLDGASVNTEADYYATPLGDVKVDRETAMQLVADSSGVFSYRPQAHDKEHCLEVQLPFLQRFFARSAKEVPPIVPIIISTNDYSKLQRMAEVLKPYFNDERSAALDQKSLATEGTQEGRSQGENLFIVSSDFSHYPSYGDACAVDARTGKAVESGDAEQFIAAIQDNARCNIRHLETSACGAFPIITLLLMLDSQYEVRHLMYQNSGDVDNHDPDRVVGYHSFAILRSEDNSSGQTRTGTDFILSDEDKKVLKEIALQSIKDSLDGKRLAEAYSCVPSPVTLHPSPNSLHQKCGAFVSLHKHGQLRGCIGHFGEDVPLYEIVAEMARAAAFEDPRFLPLRREELSEVDIEISVLTPMRRIQSLDEFQLHRHGIYIRKGRRSGTFLPQVADEVNWTKEEFVSHCSRDKAGLGWDGWRDAELYVYEAIVF